MTLRQDQKLHLLTFLIGGLCGLAAVAFHWLLQSAQNGVIYRLAGDQSLSGALLLILVPAVGGLIVGAALHYWAPEAGGSGIPQVKAAFFLEGGRIPARVIPAKMLLPAIGIGTGASLGREGPTVQICAAIASLLGRVFDLKRERLRSLVPVGAAAGLAAAFNTPIAAVTFTLEEILGDTAAKPLGSIVIASVIASVVERWLLGEHALFSVPAYRLNGPGELPFYVLLGLAAGLVAVAFKVWLLRLRAWCAAQALVPRWATAGAGGLVVGALGLAALLATGSASVYGVGYEQLAAGLQGPLPVRILLVLGVLKLAATVVSYGSGASGGIFGPSLYIGGMLGGLVGLLASGIPGSGAEPGAFALVGMGAVFAGIVRAPITSIVIIFEMTNNYSVILPLMAANITSYALARRLSPTPIYDALLLQDQLHLPEPGGHALRKVRVAAAMIRDAPALDSSWTVEEAAKHIAGAKGSVAAYPVLDAEGHLVGMVETTVVTGAADRGPGGRRIGELARPATVHVHPDQPLDTALVKLGRHGVSALAVVSREDTRVLLGVVTTQAIAAAMAREAGEETAP